MSQAIPGTGFGGTGSGKAGSVTGTITTNGATGTLAVGDITNWDLVLNDGNGNVFTVLGPQDVSSEVYVTGSDLTASATQLLFNFSGGDNGYLLFQLPPADEAGQTYYCDATSASGPCLSGATETPTNPGYPDDYTNNTPTGDVVIGTVASTPEPGTISLLFSGLLGLGLWVGMKRQRQVTP